MLPTIKLSGGRVILKGGRVSCSCCDPCCLYSAAAVASDELTAEDLPATIVLLEHGSLSRSGTQYGDTTDGARYEDGVWAVYRGGLRSESSCLIGGPVEDTFEAEYQVNDWFGDIGPLTVVRQSLCVWRTETEEFSEPPGTPYAKLIYNPEELRWEAEIGLSFGGGIVDEKVSPNLSTPEGTYDSGFVIVSP